jgi:ABC-type phosphonate transport system ATPase subunit
MSSSVSTKFVSNILDCLSCSIASRSRRLDERLDDEPFLYSLGYKKKVNIAANNNINTRLVIKKKDSEK